MRPNEETLRLSRNAWARRTTREHVQLYSTGEASARRSYLAGLRVMVDAALEEMAPQFARLYSRYRRPSIAPEKLLRALLVLYSVRSQRLLMG